MFHKIRSWYLSLVSTSIFFYRISPELKKFSDFLLKWIKVLANDVYASLTRDTTVLGFGGNLISLILLSILGISTKNGWQRQKKPFCGRSLLLFLPILGLSTSLVDMVLVLKRGPHGDFLLFHALLRSCSQLVVWVMILLLSKCDHWHLIFINRVLCFWWILKPLLAIPHLQTTLSILETRCLPELSTVLLDIAFGVYLNITRLKWRSCRSRCSSTEESLLEHDNDLEEGQVNDLERSWSYWRMMTFKFINPVMSLGATKQLDFTDLLQLPSDMDPSYCHQELLSCWRVQQTNGYSQPSLFRAICASYGWQYASLGVLKVLNDCIAFLGPVLLNKLIRFLQQGSGNLDGFGIAVCLGIASISKSFLDTQYTFHLSKLKLKLRSSLMILIYRKCLCVSLAERSKFSEGEIQTFMSVDADRIVNLGNSFHDIWSLPLQIGIALYLLYTQVKFAFLSGLAIVILLIPVNKWIAELIASATGKMMKQKDERIRRTGELLTYIRTLKMYGWELLFTDWLMKTRSTEVKHLSTRKYLDAWCVFFWATTPTLFSFFTFGLFTLMGNQLDAAMVFTCLALFNTLISPLNSFPWVINGLIDAIISTRRLSRFLSCPEHTGSPISSFNDLSNVNDDMVVVVQDAICSWSFTEEGEQNFVLNHITLQLPKGQMIAIVGEVGSGKSSLLSSILGETRLISGLIHFKGSVAYVSQVPWILYGTIRNNILFGRDYDPQRYSDVLKVCALDTDISQMVGGDMAYIGEKGANLSGGQKARLALARAIYQCCDVFLLDDILSAVDAHVAQWILTNAIFGPLMNQQTRVLCTHNIQAITAADKIIIMDKGSIKWLGSPSEFPMSSYSDSSLKCYDTSVTQNGEFSLTSKDQQGVQLERNSEIIQEGAQEIDEVEVRKEGKVEPAVYKNYATFSGWFTVCIICISAILMQASRNGNDLWLSYWVDTTRGTPPTDYSMSFYLIVLCIFCVVNSALTLVRAFSFAFGGLRAAVQVHDILISKLVNAPVYFFDQTPGGRILNRFSSDLYTIDDSLPFIMNILLANLVGLLGIAIVLSYVQVLFLLVLIPFWYFYSKLQFYYRSTSRELRRLDSVSRSPIYSTFTETLDGSSTIRAFGSQDLFMTRFIEHVMLYQKTSYSEFTASLWLSLRLQLIGAFVVSFIAVMAVVGSQGKLPISLGTPGLVGLALSYAAPIVSLLGSFLTSFTETEKEMVAVERVLQYMDVPQEEIQGCQSLNPDWPSEGCVEFQNVTLRYKPSLPAALSDVSFTIAGGLQVGIIGRTGAGKSSILNALFRLAPICKGSILVDGINVADLSVRDLRRSFAVVPQNPFLFEGTLRDNLDPFQQFDDSKIWSSLEKCHIKQEIQTAGGLDVHVKQSGTSFSVGQRQLICLARAFLKSSKVLCLDECTANVDTQTSSILQNAISDECRGTTVITIAHRISTVAKMDSILILDHGVLVEQGNPQVLVRDKTSRFSSFAKASVM